jgi:hypothetical protein
MAQGYTLRSLFYINLTCPDPGLHNKGQGSLFYINFIYPDLGLHNKGQGSLFYINLTCPGTASEN